MRLTLRPYQDENDYWRIRAFLREVFLLNGRRELSWQVARLDYWRYFGNPNFEKYPLEQAIYYWETDDGHIAAMICPESRGQVYLNVHPGFAARILDAEILQVAEDCLSEPDAETGGRKLTVWAHQHDTQRVQVLTERGYIRGDWPEMQHRRSLELPIPEVAIPSGYTIRALGDRNELPMRSWLSWRVFHPNEPDTNYMGWDWYLDIQRCPLYRRDLDLVAVAPNGELAAFCGIWYDDVTRAGYFEPVGTAPEHERRGLARATMTEGLRRLKSLGGIQAHVGGYSEAANALYARVMSPDHLVYERWHWKTKPV